MRPNSCCVFITHAWWKALGISGMTKRAKVVMQKMWMRASIAAMRAQMRVHLAACATPSEPGAAQQRTPEAAIKPNMPSSVPA